MNSILSLLGSLPASTSKGMSLNMIDAKKILRMGLVVFAGAFCLSFSHDLQAIDFNQIMSLEQLGKMLGGMLIAAMNAGGTALTASLMETVRRVLTNNQVIPSQE